MDINRNKVAAWLLCVQREYNMKADAIMDGGLNVMMQFCEDKVVTVPEFITTPELIEQVKRQLALFLLNKESEFDKVIDC